jgi:hypothetical protein
MSRVVRSSRKVYSVLVKLYPATLRRGFAAEMLDVFEEQLEGAWTENGVSGLMQVWGCVIAEIRGPAALRLLQTLFSIPTISLLSSSVLFLLFFWAGGFAKSCP